MNTLVNKKTMILFLINIFNFQLALLIFGSFLADAATRLRAPELRTAVGSREDELKTPIDKIEAEDGMFTSSTDLQALIVTESELVVKLNQYVMEETQRIEQIKKVIQQYEELRDSALGAEEKFVGNPLNSFLLIKKLTTDWKSLQSLIENTATLSADGLKWPSDEDLNGAAVGLMRLQDTYR